MKVRKKGRERKENEKVRGERSLGDGRSSRSQSPGKVEQGWLTPDSLGY